MTREASIDHGRMIHDREMDLLSGNRAGGVWAQELLHAFDRQGSDAVLAYNGQGLMSGFGVDDYIGSNMVAGLSFALDHSSFDESRISGDNEQDSRYLFSLYTAGMAGNLVVSATATGGLLHSSIDRALAINGVTRNTTGGWDGYTYSGDITARVHRPPWQPQHHARGGF